MVMTKTEMESHASQYNAKVESARAALDSGHFEEALGGAMDALQHVEGKLRYSRKNGGDDPQCKGATDLILNYAPVLFRADCLNAVNEFCKKPGRVFREAMPGLEAELLNARALLGAASGLFSELARDGRPVVPAPAGKADVTAARRILALWEKVGFVRQIADGSEQSYALVTRMDDVVLAKCPSCGAVGKATKARCLEELGCPRCHTKVHFVILAKGT
jgi:hypothetical protein